MKKIRMYPFWAIKLIVVLNAIFCYTFCAAQHKTLSAAQRQKSNKAEIELSAYIFEGKVIKQNIMRNPAYTCSLIQITKIYKGSALIKTDTIKVITEQSSKYYKIVDGGPGIYMGYTYILFCNHHSHKLHDPDSLATVTNNPVDCSDFIVFQNNNVVQWGDVKYSTVDSVYSIFKQNGVEVPEETEQK